MPRASLPPILKNLRLFDVVLTQHTEEDLLAYYYKELPEFERIGYKILNRKDTFIGKLMDTNPYAKVNWKSATLPEKIDFDWAEGHDGLEDKLVWLLKFRQDINLLDRAFKWEETNEGFRSMMYDVEKLTSQNNQCDLDFTTLNAAKYKSSYETWKKENHAYLEAQNLAHEHEQGQHTMKYWEQALPSEHPDFFIQYIKPKVEKCKACINAIQADLDRIELEKMKKAESKVEPRVQPVEVESPKAPRMELPCNLCKIVVHSKGAYDAHCKTHEHLMKARYCACCETQCRTNVEYENHMNSKKHKVRSGEIEQPTEFRCEACDYTTGTKFNYERHCKSGPHLLKTGA
jgi:hypothetical protein